MKLLLDEHLPHRLRPLIVGHEVFTVAFMGWRGLSNGVLLAKAAEAGFDALITIDAGIQYEQNLSALPCSVIILKAPSNALEHLQPLLPNLLRTLSDLKPRTCVRIQQ